MGNPIEHILYKLGCFQYGWFVDVFSKIDYVKTHIWLTQAEVIPQVQTGGWHTLKKIIILLFIRDRCPENGKAGVRYPGLLHRKILDPILISPQQDNLFRISQPIFCAVRADTWWKQTGKENHPWQDRHFVQTLQYNMITDTKFECFMLADAAASLKIG